MLTSIPLNKILFLDIETVPEYYQWEELNEATRKLWDSKTVFQRGNEFTAEEFYHKRAGILAEFGKIVCISVGLVNKDKIRLKSFYGFDEKEILKDFATLFSESYFDKETLLCAYNGKEFDFPYLCRRFIINQIPLPSILDLHGKKPWEIPHLDALDLWKFGDYKHYTSLALLAHVLNVPTPKDDIDGSQVAQVFYEEKNIERIKIYCEKDVVTLIQVFRRFRFEPLLEVEQ